MEIRFVALDLSRLDTLRFEAACLPCFEDDRPLRGAAGLCDWRLCGRLSRVLATGRVRTMPGEIVLLPGRPRLPFDKLLLVGLGARARFDRERFDAAMVHLFDTLAGLRLRTFAMALPGRSGGETSASDAMRWFLAAAADRTDLDEVMVIDDPEAHRVMQPIVDAERRRVRAARVDRE